MERPSNKENSIGRIAKLIFLFFNSTQIQAGPAQRKRVQISLNIPTAIESFVRSNLVLIEIAEGRGV